MDTNATNRSLNHSWTTHDQGRCVMTKIIKTLTVLATAATLIVGAVAVPQSAEAHGWRGHGGGWHGGGYGYGVGAFAARALGGAAAGRRSRACRGPGRYSRP